jgi:excisionase family DNA binding protein
MAPDAQSSKMGASGKVILSGLEPAILAELSKIAVPMRRSFSSAQYPGMQRNRALLLPIYGVLIAFNFSGNFLKFPWMKKNLENWYLDNLLLPTGMENYPKRLILRDYGMMEKPTNEEVLTVKEASGYLKIAEKTLYRFIREQNIPAFKLGREWRFKRSLLDAWMEKRINQTQDER